ncbi:maleylacetate reductase [Corynebacterium ammoniagenes]|uniref:maleylacetate reductase n=1 Tax=Corynebacterium ammoniagenes TaxID=1697 RepID=UPI0014592E4E|nr:maleylacetate reductase [Corynebacterium ammoniagenes]NMF31792.1 maleylacetate reductase [Corynebacterium ammoniagenes]
MALSFDHITLGQRVKFGAGQAAQNLAEEVERLDARRIMMISSKSGVKNAEQIAAHIDVHTWHTDVVMHVPKETADKARQVAADNKIDLLVSVGGGSATGLAKAIALTSAIPLVAIPTTYSGSEATNVWGLTEGKRKSTGVDDKVLPKTVIYDSELMLSLPVEMSVASGLNALAHCVDSLWAPQSDPINAALAGEGIRALNTGLPKIAEDPRDITGRDEALYGAYLSAVAFASAGSGLHHKICHVLGGTFDLPHAQTHATVLPYVLAFNAPKAPDAEARMAAAFGAENALEGLQNLRKQVDAPQKLSDYGFASEGIPEAVEVILEKVPANNPRDVTAANMTALLTAALHGDNPAALDW